MKDYVADEWHRGDLARMTTDRPNVDDTVTRMLLVQRHGPYAGRRLWWGPAGFIEEQIITGIEPVTALTHEELNRREEVIP